jgi:hypothetical protein
MDETESKFEFKFGFHVAGSSNVPDDAFASSINNTKIREVANAFLVNARQVTDLGYTPDLERVRPICNDRRGSTDSQNRYFPCNSCNGAGHVPTDFGEKVLALMRHTTSDRCTSG